MTEPMSSGSDEGGFGHPSPGYNPQQPYGAQAPPVNGQAIAALIVGILSLPAIITIVGGPVLGIVAIVLGVLGLRRAAELGGAGRGQAIGGIVTGVLGLLIPLLLAAALLPWFVESGVVESFDVGPIEAPVEPLQ